MRWASWWRGWAFVGSMLGKTHATRAGGAAALGVIARGSLGRGGKRKEITVFAMFSGGAADAVTPGYSR